MEITELLSDYLDNHGYSDQEFADLCGRTRMTIYNRKTSGWKILESDDRFWFMLPSGDIKSERKV